jgi:hypothetical protein
MIAKGAQMQIRSLRGFWLVALWGWLFIFTIACNVSADSGKSIFDDDWTPPKRVDVPPIPPAPPAPAALKPAVPVNPVVPAPAAPVITPPAVPPAAAATQQRAKIPAKSDQDRSRKLMREIYAAPLAEKSPAGRRKLAQQLLKESEKVRDNPVDRYVLLAGAIEAGKEGASIADCTTAADAMAAAYEVDGLALKADSAAKIAPQTADPSAAKINAAVAFDLADQLARIGDFASATRICSNVQTLAGATPELRQAAQQRVRDLAVMKSAKDRFVAGAEKLKTSRDDPAANLAVGVYYSFCLGDWNAGLPFLTRAPESAVKAAAVADIANPQTPEARASVGDGWWTAAEKDAVWQRALKARAAAWYEDVITGGKLTGLSRVRIEKRLAEFRSAQTPAETAPAATAYRFCHEIPPYLFPINDAQIPEEFTIVSRPDGVQIAGEKKSDSKRIGGQLAGWFGKGVLFDSRSASGTLQAGVETTRGHLAYHFFIRDKDGTTHQKQLPLSREVAYSWQVSEEGDRVILVVRASGVADQTISTPAADFASFGWGVDARNPKDAVDITIRFGSKGTPSSRDKPMP